MFEVVDYYRDRGSSARSTASGRSRTSPERLARRARDRRARPAAGVITLKSAREIEKMAVAGGLVADVLDRSSSPSSGRA